MSEAHFFNPLQGVDVKVNRLPHWQQNGGIYFVTFRLADSLPVGVLAGWERERQEWLLRNPPPWEPEREVEYHRVFSMQMEQWLDAGRGSCVLADREVGDVVAGALRFYEGRRSEMFSFVVMPNHVHALFALTENATINGVVRDWKSYSSHELKKRLGEQWPGWQKDYFDRLVRGTEHFGRCVRYIRKNPARARMREDGFVLWESGRARAVE